MLNFLALDSLVFLNAKLFLGLVYPVVIYEWIEDDDSEGDVDGSNNNNNDKYY